MLVGTDGIAKDRDRLYRQDGSPLLRLSRVWYLAAGYLYVYARQFGTSILQYVCPLYVWHHFGRLWGSWRFLIFYLVTGIGAGIAQELVWHLTLGSYHPMMIDYLLTIGASGAVYGILLGFGMMFPNAPIFFMFIPIPIKAKWFVIGYGLLELFLGITGSADGVAHFAHLGGMIFGFVLIKLWEKKARDRQYFDDGWQDFY